jgi:hypothetical protein
MDYDKAKGLDPGTVRRAWWERVEFDARYPQAGDSADPWQAEDPSLVKTPYPPPPAGSWDISRYPQNPTPQTNVYPDMSRPSLSGWTRATQSWDGADPREAVWYRVEQRKTAQYPQIGIFAPHAPVKDDGSPWPYTSADAKTYYHVTLRRFNGAELTTDTPLQRTYLPPAGTTPDLGPIFFAPEGENLTENVVQHFTFNGFAYRSGKVTNWKERFINPNPIEDLVCYAQARVYMPVWPPVTGSWDLFTQCWKVKLVRADRWKDLIPELDKNVPADGSSVASELTADRKKPVRDMLGAYNWEFVKEFTH